MTGHKQITDGHYYSTAYSYNLSGQLVEQTYPSGRKVKNSFDVDGDLAKVETQKAGAGWQDRAENFTYNAAGAVTSLELGNGRWESTQFNTRLQPTQIALGTTQGATNVLKLDYFYGTTTNNGNVHTQSITVPGLAQPFIQTYIYDDLNRLKSATEAYDTTQTWKQTFVYDRYGNRRFDFTGGNTTFPASSCTEAICNPTISTSNNRLTSTGYSYDNAGNTTTDAQGRTFVYDGENKQTSVSDTGGTIGTYSYDGDGKRVKKVSANETVVFVYNAMGQLVAEYADAISSTPKVNYLTADHLGSPRINTDQNAAVTARHDYHPFGEEIATSQRTSGLGYAADTVRKQFTGYERDNESELDFAQNRYYKPDHGRFTSTDPLLSSARLVDPQSWNRYAYVLNSPLRYVDPLGLYECGTSVTEKQCQKFEQARLDLEKARDHYQKKGDTTKADALSNALTAIGTLNDKNGLTIEIGKVSKGAAAETSFGLGADGKPLLAKDDGNGNYVANVVMTFKSADDMTAEVLSHEGSHTEDRQKFIAAMFAASAKDPEFDDNKAKALPENLTKYATESKAYRNSSYVQEYKGVEGDYWKRGWAEVDRQKAINHTLRTSNLYKVTPESPGTRIYETMKKP